MNNPTKALDAHQVPSSASSSSSSHKRRPSLPPTYRHPSSSSAGDAEVSKTKPPRPYSGRATEYLIEPSGHPRPPSRPVPRTSLSEYGPRASAPIKERRSRTTMDIDSMRRMTLSSLPSPPTSPPPSYGPVKRDGNKLEEEETGQMHPSNHRMHPSHFSARPSYPPRPSPASRTASQTSSHHRNSQQTHVSHPNINAHTLPTKIIGKPNSSPFQSRRASRAQLTRRLPRFTIQSYTPDIYDGFPSSFESEVARLPPEFLERMTIPMPPLPTHLSSPPARPHSRSRQRSHSHRSHSHHYSPQLETDSYFPTVTSSQSSSFSSNHHQSHHTHSPSHHPHNTYSPGKFQTAADIARSHELSNYLSNYGALQRALIAEHFAHFLEALSAQIRDEADQWGSVYATPRRERGKWGQGEGVGRARTRNLTISGEKIVLWYYDWNPRRGSRAASGSSSTSSTSTSDPYFSKDDIYDSPDEYASEDSASETSEEEGYLEDLTPSQLCTPPFLSLIERFIRGWNESVFKGCIHVTLRRAQMDSEDDHDEKELGREHVHVDGSGAWWKASAKKWELVVNLI
ncbi:hypothetical protein DL93DRAFT_2169432 [Clavulina sp. PMI_390]|nr:hypothetical protein DL93DRAFT_2169432 [Clavulina sp. PMI_390]